MVSTFVSDTGEIYRNAKGGPFNAVKHSVSIEIADKKIGILIMRNLLTP